MTQSTVWTNVFPKTLPWSQCLEIWDGWTDQSSFCPAINDPAAATAKKVKPCRVGQSWEHQQALKYLPGCFHGWRRVFKRLFLFPFPKPPQTWLTGRVILAQSSASRAAPPWHRWSLSREIRAVGCHDRVQWHTELSRSEAQEYEIESGALFSF